MVSQVLELVAVLARADDRPPQIAREVVAALADRELLVRAGVELHVVA